MTYEPGKHHRRSVRLEGYDYAQAGAYFVTLCTKDRECLFGEVVSGEMQKNSAGGMIQKAWNALPAKYADMEVDECIVMPNHIHGIIVLLVGAGPCACPVFQGDGYPDREGHRQGINKGHPQGGAPTRLALPDIVHRFKSFTTAQYRTNVLQNNSPPFPGKLWQRNYYEHIVRNADELNRIREYIVNNPARWTEDEDNPANLNRRQ